MVRDDLKDISDEDFAKIIDPIEEKILNYVKDNFLNDYIAFYLNECYQSNTLFKEPLESIIDGAINLVSQFKFKDCDVDKIKDILNSKYNLTLKDDKDINIIG